MSYELHALGERRATQRNGNGFMAAEGRLLSAALVRAIAQEIGRKIPPPNPTAKGAICRVAPQATSPGPSR